MIYTSNFARHGKHPDAVSISIKPIWWFKGRQYLPLAPTWDIVTGVKSGAIDEKQYTERYLEILNKLDPQQVVDDIGDGSIMLCYESPKDFCHRHIVAEWLNNHLGLGIEEIYFKELREKQEAAKTIKPDTSLLEF